MTMRDKMPSYEARFWEQIREALGGQENSSRTDLAEHASDAAEPSVYIYLLDTSSLWTISTRWETPALAYYEQFAKQERQYRAQWGAMAAEAISEASRTDGDASDPQTIMALQLATIGLYSNRSLQDAGATGPGETSGHWLALLYRLVDGTETVRYAGFLAPKNKMMDMDTITKHASAVVHADLSVEHSPAYRLIREAGGINLSPDLG